MLRHPPAIPDVAPSAEPWLVYDEFCLGAPIEMLVIWLSATHGRETSAAQVIADIRQMRTWARALLPFLADEELDGYRRCTIAIAACRTQAAKPDSSGATLKTMGEQITKQEVFTRLNAERRIRAEDDIPL